MSEYQTLCQVTDVPEGSSRMFRVEEQMVGLFHVNGDFLAVSNECPHAGASLAHGTFDGDVVTCRIHHWKFCLRTGQYLDADRPQYNIRTFETKVVDGQVQIRLNETPRQ